MNTPQRRPLGFWHASALVAGNMIGSGIFLLPASLAVFGGYSMFGWMVSTVGALLLAITFARLSRRLPATGGPYLYTQRAYGDFPGFLVAWGYWIALWTGNAAIALAFISSLAAFFPFLNTNTLAAVSASLLAVWAVTGLNLRGVREAAQFQLITTVLRLVPIILLGTVGFAFFHFDRLSFALPPGGSGFDWTLQTAALTLWSFLGVESATIPAAEIRDPGRNVARATLAGTALSAVVYIAACTAVMGIVPREVLPHSPAPFADAARQVWGSAGFYLVAAAAAIACLGALNGWILLQGQIPWAAARDGLFPAFFRRKNRHDVPAVALVLSSVLLSGMILLNYTETLQRQFEHMILLSTLSSLFPYLFCSCAELVLRWRKEPSFQWKDHPGLLLLSALTALFSLAAITGTGGKTIISGLLLLVIGVPVFLWQRRNKARMN